MYTKLVVTALFCILCYKYVMNKSETLAMLSNNNISLSIKCKIYSINTNKKPNINCQSLLHFSHVEIICEKIYHIFEIPFHEVDRLYFIFLI